MEKLRIVVGGFIGLYPTGGATIDYIQYPLGLSKMGHDVYYIEDTNIYPIYQDSSAAWDDATACITYLKNTMEYFGLQDRWAYRDIGSGKAYGMTEARIDEVCKTADVFINISFSTVMRDEYFKIPNRILIDTDPMFTQIQYVQEESGEFKSSTRKMVDSHNYIFTFGENIGNDDCLIPTLNLNWLTTRQPICLDLWSKSLSQPKMNFTSVLNWSGRQKLQFNNNAWGQKDVEFMKFLSLPFSFNDIKFDIVINPPLNTESSFDLDLLRKNKWNVFHPSEKVKDFPAYMDFIKSSSAEFSIAKETYVKSKSGWFSCRSACYLASGIPVIAQETGWSKFIRAGGGLIAFHDQPTAIEAVKTIKEKYDFHSAAAKQLANEYFDSHVVLEAMLNKLK
jgi:hypothetical protein